MQTQNVHFSLQHETRCGSYGTKQDGDKDILELKWCMDKPWFNSIQKTCHGPGLKGGTTFFLYYILHVHTMITSKWQIFKISQIPKLFEITSYELCNFLGL